MKLNSLNLVFDSEESSNTHDQAFMAAREYAESLSENDVSGYTYGDPLYPDNWDENYDDETEVLSFFFIQEKLVINVFDVPPCLYYKELEQMLEVGNNMRNDETLKN